MQLKATKTVAIELFINGESMGFEDILTMDGLESIASFMGTPQGHTTAWMPYIALGSGDTGPSTESRHLENEELRQIATISSDGITYIANSVFAITSAFVLREVSIQKLAQGGRLAAHWALTSDISLVAGDSVDVTCRIYIG